jgi:DNA-binding LytR/AlgR family response regulator
MLNLTKLNNSLDNYQRQLIEKPLREDAEITQTSSEENEDTSLKKTRILTYVRNELLPIATEDIAYLYVENTITYVISKEGKRATSNESLDQIYTYLNTEKFFRANRQIIVAISAIEKITKYGNSKLKIEVLPASEIDIIIGKNKAASFKQWLDS